VRRKCGKQPDFSDLSFLLLAVVAVVLKTFSDSALARLLASEEALREACGFCRTPHRTQIGRRLKADLNAAEDQVSVFGEKILLSVKLPENCSLLSAADGRMDPAQCACMAGTRPPTSFDSLRLTQY
jgi:hypothetical protein